MWVVVIVIVLGGAYWFMKGYQAPMGGTASDTQENVEGMMQQGMPIVGGNTPEMIVMAPMSATVSYDGSAFSPADVTIKKGGSVTFTSTGVSMWVASAVHPHHTKYAENTLEEHCPDTAGTAFDQCETGATYTMKFDKVGTWPYHNHVKGGAYGKITVIE